MPPYRACNGLDGFTNGRRTCVLAVAACGIDPGLHRALAQIEQQPIAQGGHQIGGFLVIVVEVFKSDQAVWRSLLNGGVQVELLQRSQAEQGAGATAEFNDLVLAMVANQAHQLEGEIRTDRPTIQGGG